MTGHDDFEARLREALHDHAERIVPEHRLDAVLGAARDGTVVALEERRARRSPWLVGAAAAAAAAVAWAALAGGPDRSARVAGPPPPSATTVAPPAQQGPTVAAAVYSVGRERPGTPAAVLVRTFTSVTRVEDPAEQLTRAVGQALATSRVATALQTATGVVGAESRSVVATGREVTVTLTDGGTVAQGGTVGAEALVASWVRTVQGVLGRGDLPVRFVVPGGGPLLGSLPSARAWRQADVADVPLAAIWVDAPAPGTTLSRARAATASGLASVFEGSLAWQLRRDGTTVAEGHATASEGAPARGSWSVPIGTLAAGSYGLRVYSLSPRDGSLAAERTVSFEVR